MAGDAALTEPPGKQVGHRQGVRGVTWQARARVLLVWLATLLICTLVLVAPLPFTGQVLIQAGEVARTDVTAPRRVTYVSEILTAERHDKAAAAVPDVYDPPQARIGRQQLNLANRILDFIASVRSDSYADLTTKAGYLAAINGLKLSPEATARILTLSDAAWERVSNEVQSVLEIAMRDEIRENNLADVRSRVPSLVRLDLSDEDAALVRDIVSALLVPNSFYNAEKTEALRQEARQRVDPVQVTIARDEIVLRAGTIVTPADIEALEALGLRQTGWNWKDVRVALALVFMLGIVFLYYIWREQPQIWSKGRVEWLLLPMTIPLFLVAARISVPAHALLPYLFPYAALAMLLTVVLGLDIALVSMGFFVLLLGWLTGGSLELMTYAFCSALIGALRLRRGEHLSDFAWAAVYVAGVSVLVVATFRVVAGEYDLRGMSELSAAAVINGLTTMAVALIGIYLAGALLGIVTTLQLIEISRPTHPLLRQLLLKAPGTYHHTLIVSNMAERACEAVGADGQLARVGAYYHDVGKTIRPYFFIENRSDDVDPHARLDPYTSAQIIISHVEDGIALARKYHIPRRIIDFIPEHQGTLLVHYFYHQAIQQAGAADQVEKAQFRYPGPKPQSRETGITMLADGVEATVRARHPGSLDEMAKIIAESVQSRVNSGELDDCGLTLADLKQIRRAFFDVLRGIHHPRINYPTDPPGRLASNQSAAAGQAGQSDKTEQSHVPTAPERGHFQS
jgi:putative nucleotidyltransferase with HDIG domain